MSHFLLPLTVSPTGGLVTLDEGSPAEIAQSAQVLLATRIGDRVDEPTYGSAQPVFNPLGGLSLDVAALQYWEPRATPDVVTIQVTSSGGGASSPW